MGFACDLMQNVASCDYLSVDVLQQDDEARLRFQPIISAVNPDLRPFKARGGKMIQYAGWADAAIPPENGLNYYRKVTRTVGDPRDFYRVFMVPGMAHSAAEPAPTPSATAPATGP
jgi:feruloyl esterase